MDIEIAYNKALDYLYSFVDYSLKHISELAKAEFNLDRMFALMDELGNPQTKYPIIHVTGTKGKGSVSALCASALQAGGYKAGLYTSPHLLDYCERIQINGESISHEQLVELVEEIKPAVAKIPKLTTFEITTAIGFLAFANQGCNVAVIEVGLGGRLDATNIVMPKVSVITSLSYDHMAVLGDTLAKIAGEKAGIIKHGVPVVSSPQKEEALEVLGRVAKLEGCEFTLVGKDVKFGKLGASLDSQSLTIALPKENRDDVSGAVGRVAERTLAPHAHLPRVQVPGSAGVETERSVALSGEAVSKGRSAHVMLTIPLLGKHQVENAATAYTALKASGIPISDTAIQKGFSQVKWHARFEVVRRHPPVVIDSAHNRDSALRLRESLDEYFPNKPVVMLFCVLEDKDISGILEELKPRLDCVIATRADHPRAPSAESIAEQVKAAGVTVETVIPVASAMERALELAGSDKVVLSAGSVAFAGEVSAAWEGRKKLKAEEQAQVEESIWSWD